MKIELAKQSRALAALVVLFLVAVDPTTRGHAAEKSVEEINRLLLQGREEMRQDKFDQAIRTFSAALDLKPTGELAAEIYGQRAGAYVDKKVLDKAMADGETAVRLAPKYFRGYQVRGRVYRLRKQFDRALYQFDTALTLAPNFAQIYNNRGNVFVDKDQPKRAIQDFSEAIHRAPESIDGYVNRGGSYVTLGEFDKAIVDLNRAVQLDPRDSASYYYRGLAYEGKKNHQAALADFSKANEFSPRDPEFLNWIAWLRATSPHDDVRNGKEALTPGLKACELTNFKTAEYLDTLAAAYAENGDFDQAIRYLTKALGMKINSSDRKEFQQRLALYHARKPYRETKPARSSATRE